MVSESLISRSLSLEMKRWTRFSNTTRSSGLSALIRLGEVDPGATVAEVLERVRPSAWDRRGRPTASYFHDSFGVTSVSHSHD